MPPEVKYDVARLLGSPVARAARVYGGYAPSATFRMVLADGRRAFFKGVSAASNDYMRGALPREERVYRELGHLIRPWAPAFLGSVKRLDWQVLLLEDVGRQTMPPWSPAKARRSARSFAAFHASTHGRPLPRWLSRTEHHEFAELWRNLSRSGELAKTAGLARRRADEAREWLDVALPELRQNAGRLAQLGPPHSLLHFDTRSDNVRLDGEQLRMFDWNFASVGPHEIDAAAFAQATEAEGGPPVDRTMGWYAEVMPLRKSYVDASVAGIAGYFADRAWRPPIPGVPRVRAFQRRQLKVSLAWAARLLGLPEPLWLAAVPD
ncbi:MAG TPA: phosphotransferase [Candidatus Limnocylindria bacterium]|nr:phosphotransferase [Candidatus Limnocylindria bacterium]